MVDFLTKVLRRGETARSEDKVVQDSLRDLRLKHRASMARVARVLSDMEASYEQGDDALRRR